jgi:hypothetical protein
MATPVYGKQYIRFAETGYVPENLPLEAFSLVAIAAGAATEPPTLEVATGGPGTNTFGVLQQDMPAVDAERAVTLPRLGTVATSGLLLVKADAGAIPAQGERLETNGSGEAIAEGSGSVVYVNGIVPTVRQYVQVGGVDHVLVSFS